MDAPNKTKTDTPLPETLIRQGIHLFYSKFIRPKCHNEDERRKELILNSVLVGIIAVIAVLDLTILLYSVLFGKMNGTEGIPFAVFSVFLITFIGIYGLSRKGRVRDASYLTILIYFAGSTYGVYTWGMGLPAGLLSYALIITMSTMLLGARFGIAISLTIVSIILSLAYMESSLRIIPAWKKTHTFFTNGIQYSILLLSITGLSRIYWRDLQASLERARKSEKELRDRNDSLEDMVEERTSELRRSQAEQISQLYRFAEFGRISSGVFHDLINPLSAVALNVYNLQDVPESSHEQSKAHIDRAVRASRKMERFIASVKKQIRSENIDELFSLNHETEEAIDLLSHKASRSGVTVDFEADDEIQSYGNPLKFGQIISNLVSNAIDSYEGTEFAEREKSVSVRLKKTESGAEVRVSDKGCGILEANLARVFDPFFTTKPAEKGLGIGLSTIKDIVEREFKGTVSAASRLGSGSTFTVRIPLNAYEAGLSESIQGRVGRAEETPGQGRELSE
ncbi:MAG TPA: MFS domain-containing histidine kinase [Candidatus Paceibacterota bacterium]